MHALRTLLLVLIAATVSSAVGRIDNGVLIVDGKPFYPIGAWGGTPELAEQLSMNAILFGAPKNPDAVARTREAMQSYADHGVWSIPYLGFGGTMLIPWSMEQIEQIAELGSEPNLLTWYIGDDIVEAHLPGIRSTATALRELTPGVPIVADYIGEVGPDASGTFRRYVDIRCQYTYPVIGDSMRTYREFFDDQREFVGDPLWTWTQCFAWGNHQESLGLGLQGFGPIPDPEQVRLMVFTAVAGGVRGILYYPGRAFQRLPELSGEVALVNRETLLFNDHLAAGTPHYDLPASDPDIAATAFEYDGSTVVALALLRDTYHRWIDQAEVSDLRITIPWSGSRLPEAGLVSTPDLIEGTVERISPDSVRITLPSFELAGYLFLGNREEIDKLRRQVERIPESIASLIVPALASQNKKSNQVLWYAAWDRLSHSMPELLESTALVTDASDDVLAGRYDEAVRTWRRSLRISRGAVDSLMCALLAPDVEIPHQVRPYTESPYGLHMVGPLDELPSVDSPWRPVRNWQVAGTYPLDHPSGEEATAENPAPGFLRAYAPEQTPELVGWRSATTNLSGTLDLLAEFEQTEDVVAYIRTTIVSPVDATVTFGLGVNDAARVFVNGGVVYSEYRGGAHKSREFKFDAPLRKGRNDVLVKVSNLGARWGLSLQVHDPERVLTFTTE